MVEPVSVTIRGVEYPSLSEAARQLGVSHQTVFMALERGTLDSVGLGRNLHNRVRIQVNGKPYDAVAFAAKEYGINPGALRNRVRRAQEKGLEQVEIPEIGVVTWSNQSTS